MGALANMRAPELSISAQSNGEDIERRLELARWLSDWHLVAFLGTTGLFSPVSLGVHGARLEGSFAYDMSQEDMKIMVRTATAADIDDPTILDDLLRTESWQTLMTFTRESARECIPSLHTSFALTEHRQLAPQPPHLPSPEAPRTTFRPRSSTRSPQKKRLLEAARRPPRTSGAVGGTSGSARIVRSRTRMRDRTARSAGCLWVRRSGLGHADGSRRMQRRPCKESPWFAHRRACCEGCGKTSSSNARGRTPKRFTRDSVNGQKINLFSLRYLGVSRH